jgi:uncharacterized protein (TIGR03083 family)
MTREVPRARSRAEMLRAEREELIDLLETLTEEEWATPSLCEGWTVRDVAAHLAVAPHVTPPRTLVGVLRAGFSLNGFVHDSAVRYAGRGTGEIIDGLRRDARAGAKPFGVPPSAPLVDALVHGLDIRRPLGRGRPVPADAFIDVADWAAGIRWPGAILVGGTPRHRQAGVALVADDADWSHGRGPEVRGSATALILLLTGRTVAPEELSGPGLERLRPLL